MADLVSSRTLQLPNRRLMPQAAFRSRTALQDYLTLLNERDGGVGGVEEIRDCRPARRRMTPNAASIAMNRPKAKVLWSISRSVDGHHLSADPARLSRRYPASHHGLWPHLGCGNGDVFEWVFNYPGELLGFRFGDDQLSCCRRNGGWLA